MADNPTATDEHYHGDSPLGRRNSYLATEAGRGSRALDPQVPGPEPLVWGASDDLDDYATEGRYEYLIDGQVVKGKAKAQEALDAYLARVAAGE